MAADLTIGGLTPFTTIDFPGHLAAVFFCQGCPWRCGYCHNPHLQPAVGGESWRWPALLDWLETRRGLLDGVVFSGGEPLLQRALPSALAQVRQRGFAIGLHTAGSNPRRLAAVLPLVDWVGFDVKAPFDDYARITGTDGGRLARASLEALLASGKPHEIRCTVDPGRLDLTAVERMVAQLAPSASADCYCNPIAGMGRPFGYQMTGGECCIGSFRQAKESAWVRGPV